MVSYDINLGLKELYTLKNFDFDIVNNGSADLQVDDITTSSENIQISYIKTPFIIMLDTQYSMFGYIKILNTGDSIRNDYLDFRVSQTDQDSTTQSDVYRYQLNYQSIFYNTYTQVLELKNVTYIKNLLAVYIDSDEVITDAPSLILTSIDGVDVFLFPKVYRLSDKKILQVFTDNAIKNTVVDSSVKFFMSNDNNNLEIKRLSQRSM